MKTIICIIDMLTVAPIIAATGLLIYDPSRWGGEINLINILGQYCPVYFSKSFKTICNNYVNNLFWLLST